MRKQGLLNALGFESERELDAWERCLAGTDEIFNGIDETPIRERVFTNEDHQRHRNEISQKAKDKRRRKSGTESRR